MTVILGDWLVTAVLIILHFENPFVFVWFSAKSRGIAIPVDLDSQVNSLFSKSKIVMKTTNKWINMNKMRKESTMSLSRDYRSIIEGLQVCVHVFLSNTVIDDLRLPCSDSDVQVCLGWHYRWIFCCQ